MFLDCFLYLQGNDTTTETFNDISISTVEFAGLEVMNGWNETELEVTCWDHSLPKTREQRGGVGGGEESRGVNNQFNFDKEIVIDIINIPFLERIKEVHNPFQASTNCPKNTFQ